MNIEINKVKIIVTIPIENVDEVRNAICEAGAGVIGNYTHCSMSTKCVGTFKPTDEANPYIGERNNLEFVEEEKLEWIDIEDLPNINQFEQNEKFTPYLFKDELFEGKFLLGDSCKVLNYQIRKM